MAEIRLGALLLARIDPPEFLTTGESVSATAKIFNRRYRAQVERGSLPLEEGLERALKDFYKDCAKIGRELATGVWKGRRSARPATKRS